MDPYQVLGVSPTATDDEVKKVYRQLCKKYHPDANVGKPDAAQAEKKFMEVQQAYEEIMHRRQGGGARAGSGYNGGQLIHTPFILPSVAQIIIGNDCAQIGSIIDRLVGKHQPL